MARMTAEETLEEYKKLFQVLLEKHGRSYDLGVQEKWTPFTARLAQVLHDSRQRGDEFFTQVNAAIFDQYTPLYWASAIALWTLKAAQLSLLAANFAPDWEDIVGWVTTHDIGVYLFQLLAPPIQVSGRQLHNHHYVGSGTKLDWGLEGRKRNYEKPDQQRGNDSHAGM